MKFVDWNDLRKERARKQKLQEDLINDAMYQNS